MSTFRYNSADKSANIVLSSDDMVAGNANNVNASINGVRSVGSKNSGKWYAEWYIEQTSMGNREFAVGWISAAHSLTSYPGNQSGQTGAGWRGRFKYLNGSSSYMEDGVSNGGAQYSTLMTAIDFENGRVWFGLDGTWFNEGNPATGAVPAHEHSSLEGGTALYLAVTMPDLTSPSYVNRLRVRTDAGVYVYDPPEGFSPLWVDTQNLNPGDQALGLDAETGARIHLKDSVLSAFGFGAEIGGSRAKELPLPDQLLGLAAVTGGLNITRWVAENQHLIQRRYYVTLTGGADGVADYAMPGLKSLQFRRRAGAQSYLSTVHVYSTALANAIADRPNGTLIVQMVALVSGIETLREELVRAPLYSVRHDRGTDSQSVVLVGYKTMPAGAGRAGLQNVTTLSLMADGRRRYRTALPDFYLRPGMTASYDGVDIEVGDINVVVGEVNQYMDVVEAEA
jgi:hypothetical protein